MFTPAYFIRGAPRVSGSIFTTVKFPLIILQTAWLVQEGEMGAKIHQPDVDANKAKQQH